MRYAPECALRSVFKFTVDFPRTCRAVLPVDAPFDQPLDVHRARREMIEAVGKCVMKLFQVEVLRAALVGAIQERTIVLVIGHSTTRYPTRVMQVIGQSSDET